MSSNLSFEAKQKYGEYLDSKTIDDKIQKLQEFISLVPKHKATEKIVALNRSRLSKLKQEKETLEQRRKSASASRDNPFSRRKEPKTVQIMLLSDFFEHGLGVGKTTLLKYLTGASEGRPGNFTAEPLIGAFEWKKVKFQLIEEPALHQWQYLPRILAATRVTDIIALTIDLSKDPLPQMSHIMGILTDNSIFLNKQPPQMTFEKTGSGGIQVFFLTNSAKLSISLTEFIEEMAHAYGTTNAFVKVHQEVNVEQVEMAFNRSAIYKPAIIIATKADTEGSRENFNVLKKTWGKFTIFPVAITFDDSGAQKMKGLDEFGQDILTKLDLIRVFTKSKKGVAEKPLIVPRESNVGDVAKKIHKDLFNTFKYALVYRKGKNESDQLTKIRAGLKFSVQEFDIIEISSIL